MPKKWKESRSVQQRGAAPYKPAPRQGEGYDRVYAGLALRGLQNRKQPLTPETSPQRVSTGKPSKSLPSPYLKLQLLNFPCVRDQDWTWMIYLVYVLTS